MKSKLLVSVLSAIALLIALGLDVRPASATTISGQSSFSFSSGGYAGEVTFSIDGSGNLVIVLTNTGTAPSQLGGGQVLTALYFDATIGGTEVSLTPLSALLTAGSVVLNPTAAEGSSTDVGGNWAYKTNSSGWISPADPVQGISGTGANNFGNPTTSPALFSTNTWTTPSLDGPGFGLVPSNTGSIAPGIAGTPLIKDSVTFTLSGLPWSGSLVLSDVIFYYGTDDACTGDAKCFPAVVPEPGSLALVGFGLFALLGFGSLRHRWQRMME